MGNTMTLPMTASLSTGSLEAYIHSVYRFPVLSPEEEQRLARRLRDHDDVDAARGLVFCTPT